MKPFELLETIEKVQLLFELFTEELPMWLDYTQTLTTTAADDPQVLHEEFSRLSPTDWLLCVAGIHENLLYWHRHSRRSSREMLPLLFSEALAPYSILFLHRYTRQDGFDNDAFTYLVKGFFGEFFIK